MSSTSVVGGARCEESSRSLGLESPRSYRRPRTTLRRSFTKRRQAHRTWTTSRTGHDHRRLGYSAHVEEALSQDGTVTTELDMPFEAPRPDPGVENSPRQ